jgi:hypothetical protein
LVVPVDADVDLEEVAVRLLAVAHAEVLLTKVLLLLLASIFPHGLLLLLCTCMLESSSTPFRRSLFRRLLLWPLLSLVFLGFSVMLTTVINGDPMGLLLPFLEDVTDDSEDEAFGVGPPPDQLESG